MYACIHINTCQWCQLEPNRRAPLRPPVVLWASKSMLFQYSVNAVQQINFGSRTERPAPPSVSPCLSTSLQFFLLNFNTVLPINFSHWLGAPHPPVMLRSHLFFQWESNTLQCANFGTWTWNPAPRVVMWAFKFYCALRIQCHCRATNKIQPLTARSTCCVVFKNHWFSVGRSILFNASTLEPGRGGHRSSLARAAGGFQNQCYS